MAELGTLERILLQINKLKFWLELLKGDEEDKKTLEKLLETEIASLDEAVKSK